MLNSIIKTILTRPTTRKYCSLVTTPSAATATTKPTILPLVTPFQPKYQAPRQLWIENLDTIDEQKFGLLELHPDIFGAQPRIDVIHQNVEWQRKYRFVSYSHAKTRSERRGGGRKPWPQKGLGRARHGSIRSPLFMGGGIAHGPRSPTTHFYMLNFYHRIKGLISTLSAKLAQDDLHIVRDLEMPVDDPEYVKQLIESRLWGPSVLFVAEEDVVPRNISVATDAISHVHIQPVYGLNVYSMLKFETLVLTVAAAQQIESKLLHHLNRTDSRQLMQTFKINQ